MIYRMKLHAAIHAVACLVIAAAMVNGRHISAQGDSKPKTDEPGQWMRTWRDRTGKFSTKATFGGMEDSIVTLHKVVGGTVKLPIDKLSDVDRKWIEDQQKEKEPPEEGTIPLVAIPVIAAPLLSGRQRSAKWYEGGTLHKKSALDWQVADAGDKLATCADLVAKMWDQGQFRSDIQKSIKSVDDMRPYAQELVNFLDAATKKFPDDKKNRQIYTNQTVTDMSIIGMVMMAWPKK